MRIRNCSFCKDFPKFVHFSFEHFERASNRKKSFDAPGMKSLRLAKLVRLTKVPARNRSVLFTLLQTYFHGGGNFGTVDMIAKQNFAISVLTNISA